MSGNIGETGIESIRLEGRKLEELPLGRGEIAMEQLATARETERMNEIKGVVAAYPRIEEEWLTSRINECNNNIKGFERLRQEKNDMVGEYRVLIVQAEGKRHLSDLEDEIEEIAATDMALEEKKAAIHELKRDATPYNQIALQRQVNQFKDDITRFNKAIDKEKDSLIELTETRTLVRLRDKELKALGVEDKNEIRDLLKQT